MADNNTPNINKERHNNCPPTSFRNDDKRRDK